MKTTLFRRKVWPKIKRCGSVLMALAIILTSLNISAITADAATAETKYDGGTHGSDLPSQVTEISASKYGELDMGQAFVFDYTSSNFSYTWGSAASDHKTKKESDYDEGIQQGDNNSEMFFLALKNTGSAQTYGTGDKGSILTVKQANAGYIAGRSVDVTVTIDKIETGPSYPDSATHASNGIGLLDNPDVASPVGWLDSYVYIANSKNYTSEYGYSLNDAQYFCCLIATDDGRLEVNNSYFLSPNSSGTLKVTEYTYGLCYTDVTYSVELDWHNTTDQVDLKDASYQAYQVVEDMDIYRQWPASYSGVSSYEGTTFDKKAEHAYVFDNNQLEVHTTGGALYISKDHDKTCGQWTGNQSYQYAGAVVGYGTNSSWTNVAHQPLSCVSTISIYSDLMPISAPTKELTTNKDIYEIGDTVSYAVSQTIGTYYVDTFNCYDSYSFVDELPDGLTYKDGSVKVTSGGSTVSSDYYTVSYDSSKNTLTVSMKNSWLQDTGNYNGQVMKMTFDATVDGWYADPVYKTLVNKAYINNSGVTWDAPETPEVKAGTPVLAIDKTADRLPPDAYLYNDPDEPERCIVTYTIKVTQTTEGVTAHNTVITDTLPEELQLLTATDEKGRAADIDGNSFTLNYGDLAYGDTAVITVTAQTLLLGEDIPNTAYATADWANEVSDDVEIRIIGPKIEITKDADEYQYYVGDTVQYDVMVELEDDSECLAKGLKVTDELPDGLELVGKPTVTCQTNAKMATHAEITVAEDKKSFTVEWPVNPDYYLTLDDVVMIHVTCVATKDVANTIVNNKAVATAVNTPYDVEDDVDVEVIQPILDITKVADKYTYDIGEVVTYTIEVKQTQPGLTAYNVEIGDDLPDELKLLSVEAHATESGVKAETTRYGDNGFSVKYEQLAYGETAVIYVQAETLVESTKGITNAASAQADHTEEVSDDAVIEVIAPKLAIVKDVEKTLYSEGDTVTYTIDVTQTVADRTAKEVVVSDTLPDELKLIDAQPSAGTVEIKGNSFTVNLDELAYGDTLSIVVTAKALTEKEDIINTAKAVAKYTDEVEDDAIITVQRPDISITKTADKKVYYPDETVTYTIVVENIKAEPSAYDVVVSDTLPDGLKLTGVDADGEVAIDGNSFTVTYGEIPYGESRTITVTATALEEAANTTQHNVVIAKGSNTDEVQDDEDVEIVKPVLDITKDADKTVYSVDGDVTYTVMVRQVIEGLTAENLVISDTLPDEMELKDAVLSGIEGDVSIDGNSFTVNAPALGYGETAVVTVTAKAITAAENVINMATADADHADPVDDDVPVTVVQPDLEIIKNVDYHDHFVGDDVAYTITVRETVEGAEAYDVVIFDALPEGLTLEDVSLLGTIGEIAIDGNRFTVTFDKLAYGDEVTVNVIAKAEEEARDKIEDNVATVTASNVPEKEDDAEIIVEGPALSIVKDVDEKTHYAGEQATYTITVSQTTEDEFEENVVVTDSVPDGLIIKHITLDGVEGTVTQTGNDFKVEIPKLVYGEDAVITVTVEIDEKLEGTTVTNTAYAKGDHTPQIDDDADIDVVKPKLEITKVVDKEEISAKEALTYTITVKQVVEGLTETNVIITDTLPDEINIAGTPSLEGVEGVVYLLGNGFRAEIPELKYGDTAVITVPAFADESLESGSATNVAYASGDHSDMVQDAAKVSVNPSETEEPEPVEGPKGDDGNEGEPGETGEPGKDGTTTTTSGEGPKTGDYTNIILWIVLGVLAVGGCTTGVIVYRRRKRD